MADINNETNHTLVSGTNESDNITNTGSYVTINSGSGDDNIKITSGSYILANGGNDNDVIDLTSYNENNFSLDGGSGDDSINVSSDSSKVFISGGTGNDTIYNRSDEAKISGNNGDDVINNFANDVSITGDAGNDTIKNSGNNDGGNSDTTIYGGDGADYISDSMGSGILLNGDKGDDTIESNSGKDIIIYGGAGNDYIKIKDTENVTVSGGNGADTIDFSEVGEVQFQYSNGDGSDLLLNFGNDPQSTAESETSHLIKLVSGSVTNSSISGDDLILKIGSGIVTVKEGATKEIRVSDESGNITTYGTSSATIVNGVTLSGSTLSVDSEWTDNVIINNLSACSDVVVIDTTESNNSMIIVGNSKNNIILGGEGNNSIWGSSEGNNTLSGGSSQDKFWYTGTGNDVVTNFSSGNGTNDDVIVLNGEYRNVKRNGENLIFNAASGKSMTLQTDSEEGDGIFFYSVDGNNIFRAKVGSSSDKNLTFESDVDYYQLDGDGILEVADSGRNIVLLEKTSGIKSVSVSGSGANILVGNAMANSLVAGSGGSSLWGNVGNYADTLVGDSGVDVFWFGRGEGHDYVNNAAENDVVFIYDSTSNYLTSVASVSGDLITLNFITGYDLKVNSISGTKSSKFVFSDGATYQYNFSSSSWERLQ